MSAVESLDLKNLHVIVIQEFQSDDIQELNSDFFRNLSTIMLLRACRIDPYVCVARAPARRKSLIFL